MSGKSNYNYNFNPNNRKNQVNMWASFYIGFDFLSIVAFIACGIGIFMSVRNIIRSKKKK